MFTKGKSGNPKGRDKGDKNKKTLAWEQLGEFFTQAGAERAKEIMINANDKDFLFHYDKLIEYFKPKLQRTDLTSGGEKINVQPPTKIVIKTNGD